jgi:hypothetical protein
MALMPLPLPPHFADTLFDIAARHSFRQQLSMLLSRHYAADAERLRHADAATLIAVADAAFCAVDAIIITRVAAMMPCCRRHAICDFRAATAMPLLAPLFRQPRRHYFSLPP